MEHVFFLRKEGTLFLYSGGRLDSARSSFLFLFPYETLVISDKFNKATNPWDFLKEKLSFSSDSHSFPEWCGFFGYEMGACSDSSRRIDCFKPTTPDLYLQRSAVTLVVDNLTEKGQVLIAEHSWSICPKTIVIGLTKCKNSCARLR